MNKNLQYYHLKKGNSTLNSLKKKYLSQNSNKKSVLFIIGKVLIFFIALFVLFILLMLFRYFMVPCDERKTIKHYFEDMFNTPCKTEYTKKVDIDINVENSTDIRYKSDRERYERERREYDRIIDSRKNKEHYNSRRHKKQVFNIADQIYTYDQAKCKCAAYGSELASYKQIVDAYNNGAEWCSYGWSKGQRAYYPTQKCTWNKLQKNKRKRFKCGLPGVNGGYFPPNMKFGVNCYGKRPKGKVIKEKAPICNDVKEPKGFCELSKNTRAANKLDFDTILPFNEDNWSR